MDGDLRNMVMAFRVTELQALLSYAGKNRSGRKNELQARALELARSRSSPIVAKVKDLYKSMQASIAVTNPQPTTVGYNTPSPAMHQMYGGGGYAAKENGLNFAYHKPQVTLPICPDVKMIGLPFFDVVNVLIQPTSLMPQGMGRAQESSYSFCLTPQQAADISESKEYLNNGSVGESKIQFSTQVQLRFCSLEPPPGGESDDQFPPNILVKVNNKPIPLPHPIPSNRPGVEPKRPSRPLNITNFVRMSPTVTNTITVSWASDNTRGYGVSVYLVKKLTSMDLLARLKGKGVRPADFSRGLIKELITKDDGDCMIAMTSLKVSMACPLGKCRMILPCRATTCRHLQCFDANLFLQMNERKATWVCPVCDKRTKFEDLCIDGYFQEIINGTVGKENMDVELLPDGSWKLLEVKKEKDRSDSSPPTKKLKTDDGSSSSSSKPKFDETIDLDDDIIIEDGPKNISAPPRTNEPTKSGEAPKGPEEEAQVIDLTLSSSDEEDNNEDNGNDDDNEDDDLVTRPKRRVKKPNYVINDDSSSSSGSSSTTDASAPTRPTSPVQPMSPACITLDSRSPSPEAPSQRNQTQGSSNASTLSAGVTAAFAGSGSGSSASGSQGGRPTSNPNAFQFGGAGTYSRTSSTQPAVTQSSSFYPGGPGYTHFDNPMWSGATNNAGNFQNLFGDFGGMNGLEFGSQQDFNNYGYEPTRNNQGGYNNRNQWPS